MSAIDWRAYPQPWSAFGPDFAWRAALLARGEVVVPPPENYPCGLCDFVGTSPQSLGGHTFWQHRPKRR